MSGKRESRREKKYELLNHSTDVNVPTFALLPTNAKTKHTPSIDEKKLATFSTHSKHNTAQVS